jgi:hypothetical protein
VSFLDFEGAKAKQQNPDVEEFIRGRMAFFNNGIGRGEFSFAPEDIAPVQIYAEECWDSLLERRYMLSEADPGDGTRTPFEAPPEFVNLGDPSDCGSAFSPGLDALEITWREGLDTQLRNDVQCIGDNGLAALATLCQ